MCTEVGGFMSEPDKEKLKIDPKITFSGAGVLHIKSIDLVKSPEAQRQIEALRELKEKNFLVAAV